MYCPNCHSTFLTEDDCSPTERRVLSEEERERNRLNDAKNRLRSINKYTTEVREALWKEHNMTPAFALLIAVECIWHYLKVDLNRKLREKGLPLV